MVKSDLLIFSARGKLNNAVVNFPSETGKLDEFYDSRLRFFAKSSLEAQNLFIFQQLLSGFDFECL